MQCPALTKFTVVPLTVQTGWVVEAKVTVNPDGVAEALSAADPLRMDWVIGPTKVITCGAWPMSKLANASGAARLFVSPACDAVMKQVPTETKVTVVPETVQTGSDVET